MQSSASSLMTAQPDAILEWLQKEMGYRPLGGSYASSSKAPSVAAPSADSVRKVCRGNMIPVWNFLLQRVNSEKTVDKIRRNILVHGGDDGGAGEGAGGADLGRGRRREKEKFKPGEEGVGAVVDSREVALQERESAGKEVERLRQIVRRQRRELKARMLEVSREEAERKRMLDERSNSRLASQSS